MTPPAATRSTSALDVEIVGADAVERRAACRRARDSARCTAPCPLQRPEVGDVLDDDDDRLVAPRVRADRAGIDRIDVAAGRADADLVDRLAHGVGQRRQQLLLLLDQVQRRAAPRARPEPRHLGQQLDQAFDLGAGDSLGTYMRDIGPMSRGGEMRFQVAMPAGVLCRSRPYRRCAAGLRGGAPSARRPAGLGDVRGHHHAHFRVWPLSRPGSGARGRAFRIAIRGANLAPRRRS